MARGEQERRQGEHARVNRPATHLLRSPYALLHTYTLRAPLITNCVLVPVVLLTTGRGRRLGLGRRARRKEVKEVAFPILQKAY